MDTRRGARTSDPSSASPSPPFAWQPLTPRGIAAFAHAPFRRLVLVEFIVAAIAAGAVIWFLSTAWFPAIRHAIRQLPEAGAIRHQELNSPLTFAENLAEDRPFLLLVLDLEREANASQTSDVVVEFHQRNFQICSLFGCLAFDYPPGWDVEFNRPKLAPLWDAWEPILLALAGILVVGLLFINWALLATLYCGIVRLFGFFKDRDLNWRSSWCLASAALMPGALLMTCGIFAYGLAMVDLIRLLLLFLIHFVVGWICLAISPWFVPRLPDVLPAGANPFAASSTQPKPDELPPGNPE